MAKRKPRTRMPRTMPAETAQFPETAPVGSRRGDLGTEYHYVVEDLKRIALIAVVLIAGLVALSFII